MVLEGILATENSVTVWLRECEIFFFSLSLSSNLKKEKSGGSFFHQGNFVFVNSNDQTGYNGVFVSETSNRHWAHPPPPGPLPRGREETLEPSRNC